MGHRKPRPKDECFDSIIARKPSVSRRFLAPSLLRLMYPHVETALLPPYRACFHPASNRREDFRGPLTLEPAHGADLGCLELPRQYLQHRSPIDSTGPFFWCATLRPTRRSTSLSSERSE